MITRFVILCDHLQFRPLSAQKNAWEFMEAVGENGKSFRVWSGTSKTEAVAMKAFALGFRHEDAARLFLSQKEASDNIDPQLYAVAALTNAGALEKVIDHHFMKTGHGVERIG